MHIADTLSSLNLQNVSLMRPFKNHKNHHIPNISHHSTTITWTFKSNYAFNSLVIPPKYNIKHSSLLYSIQHNWIGIESLPTSKPAARWSSLFLFVSSSHNMLSIYLNSYLNSYLFYWILLSINVSILCVCALAMRC